MHRRGFLSLCALGAVAGCSGQDTPDHRPAPEDATSVTETIEEQYRERFSAEFDLEAGTFTTATLSPAETETVGLQVRVTQGVLDVLTIEESNVENYRDGTELDVLDGLSEVGVFGGTTLEAELDPGEYRIVLDNTAVFGAEPDGNAVGEMSLQRRLLPRAFFEFQSELESGEYTYEQVDVVEEGAWWAVTYERDAETSQRDAGLHVQDILLAYADHLPNEETDHEGLRVLVREPDAETLLEAPEPLARAYNRGELDEQEYFEEVQRSAQ